MGFLFFPLRVWGSTLGPLGCRSSTIIHNPISYLNFQQIDWSRNNFKILRTVSEKTVEDPCLEYLLTPTCTVQPKNNTRARSSFCIHKKKFFLQLIAGRLSLSPGNRKNFFAVAELLCRRMFEPQTCICENHELTY